MAAKKKAPQTKLREKRNIIAAATVEKPPERPSIWPGFRPGTVGGLISPGGAGKSFYALEASFAVAAGSYADVLEMRPGLTGPVVYISAEEPADELDARIWHIAKRFPQRDEALAILDENLSLLPQMGSRLDVLDAADLRELVSRCAGARLVVLDTLSRIHSGDENSNSSMATVLGALEYLADKTGAAVLFLHHASKAAALGGQGDTQQAARGASALVDNSRYVAYLATMTTEESEQLVTPGSNYAIGAGARRSFVRFGVSKQNYDAPQGERWFTRAEGGVLIPVELVTARERGKNETTDQEIFRAHR